MAVIKLYKKLLSPLLPRSCRFYPSCSHYALDALNKHGLVKGLHLSMVRIMKCSPFNAGGHDPVP